MKQLPAGFCNAGPERIPCFRAGPLQSDTRSGRMAGKNCLEIGAAVLKASLDDVFAKDNAKIEAARKRYFALWPNGPGIDQAERDFLSGASAERRVLPGNVYQHCHEYRVRQGGQCPGDFGRR